MDHARKESLAPMVEITPWVRAGLRKLRESNSSPVSWREYHLLVAIVALAVITGLVTFSR